MGAVQSFSLIQEFKGAIDRMIGSYQKEWIICGMEGESFPKELVRESSQVQYIQEWNLESHRYVEIFICVRGCCAIQIEKDIYQVQQGSLCFIPSGTAHSELSIKDCDYLGLWFSVRTNEIRLFLSGKDREKGFFTLGGRTIEADYEWGFLMAGIMSEINGRHHYWKSSIKSCMVQFLISIFRKVLASEENELSSEIWKENVVLEVQKYIEYHYGEHIRLGDISQEVCISTNHLNTIFKSVTGKTIISYLEDYRMGKAKDLLLETDYSVKSIACQLGYYDQYHFSKAFKKENQCTPTQFRRLSKSRA